MSSSRFYGDLETPEPGEVLEALVYPGKSVPILGGPSPWGTIDNLRVLPNGCRLAGTPSHGGLWVPRFLLERIPESWREHAATWSGDPQWFEEDGDILLAAHALELHEALGMEREELAQAAESYANRFIDGGRA